MKVFSKNIQIDSNLFESCITLLSTFGGAFAGFIYFPKNVPLSLPQFIAMSSLLGFVCGFLVSTGLVGLYKGILKKFKK